MAAATASGTAIVMLSITAEPESIARKVGRWTLAGIFVVTGTLHFIRPNFYRAIVPPGFGPPAAMVAISGAAEIAGGVGISIRPLRRAAGWGLVALLIAVFPANIYMLVARDKIPGNNFAPWMLWTRLPLQLVLIAWAIWSSGAMTKRVHPLAA